MTAATEMGAVYRFPKRSAPRVDMASVHPMSNAYGFAPVEALDEPRFTIRGWAEGYRIYDSGDLICTFHGPQVERAWKVLTMLRDDERAAKAEVQQMLEASVAKLVGDEPAGAA